MLWAVLLALLLRGPNRNRRALDVLVPLIVVHAAWLIVRQIVPAGLDDALGPAISAMAIMLAVAWLLGDRIARRHRAATFLVALLVMATVTGLAVVSDSGLDLCNEAWASLITGGLGAIVVVMSMTMAAFCCRRPYGGRLFMLWLAFWTVVWSVSLLITFAVVLMTVQSGRVPDLSDMLFHVSIGGLILSVMVYLTLLPFMILALRSPLYRPRLEACLRLAGTTPQEPDDQFVVPLTEPGS